MPQRSVAARGFAASMVLCALALAGAARADVTNIDMGVWLGHESNAPRAPSSADAAADTTQGVRLSILRNTMLDDHSGLSFRGAAAFEKHDRFPGLDNVTARADAVYRRQPLLGYLNPWYEAAFSVEQLKFADSRIRDGTIAAVSATVGKNLTDRILARAGAGYERRWAAYMSVFDTTSRKAFVGFDYRMPGQRTAHAKFTRVWGDQVVGVRPASAADEEAYFRRVDDPVFGAQYYAYRVGAITNVLDFGIVVPFRQKNALAISASYYDAYADGGQGYKDIFLRISWLYRLQ